MLKISRISRSIITVTYIAFMCGIVFFASKAQSVIKIEAWKIALYIALLVISMCFYQVLKRRLNDKIKSKMLIHMYRYVYMAVILVISRVIMIYCLKDTTALYITGEDRSLAGKIIDFVINITNEQKYAAIVINTILVYLASICIKKIVLNIFENDVIATIAGIIYILSPMSLTLCLEFNSSIFNTLFVLIGIILTLKIYDQITQYGSKNNLYIYLSVVLGAIIILDILFGGSYMSWIILGVLLNIIVDYIDSRYVDVSKFPFIQKIFKLRRNEKLPIKKSIVVLGIICIYGAFGLILASILNLNTANIIVKDGIFSSIAVMFSKIKWQYIVFSSVILVFELISVIMKRNGNVKVIIIQFCILVFGSLAILYTNTQYNLCIYDALTSIGIVLAIGNIYYNRNEKIKLLKEKN